MTHIVESLLTPDHLPVTLGVAAAVFFLYGLFRLYSSFANVEKPWAQFPVISIDDMNAKTSFIVKGNDVIKKGLTDYPDSPFQIMTGSGPKIVLPNRYMDELRNHNRLDFNEAFKPDFFHGMPGFEGTTASFNAGNLIQDTVRVKLTQSLGLVTEGLVEETRLAVAESFGEQPQWHTTNLKAPILDLVARLSSRVFLGVELCRNRAWLEIAKNYTIDIFMAAREVRKLPVWSRWLAHWWVPSCSSLRKEVKEARRLINGEVEKRRIATEKALAEGKKSAKTADAIGWMVEMSHGRQVDLVGCQLSLSMAAIHTTTEAIGQALIDIVQNPQYLQPLRDEIISVVGEHGLTRTALYQLRLMDSFLKESQRVSRPMGAIQRGILGKGDLILSDGVKIPAGSRVMIVSEHVSPKNYSDPLTFDAERFLRMREKPGQNNSHQYVTTSADHVGFGHGEHACPGRFFATNEIKIALCNLLLKYDWRFEPGKDQQTHMEAEMQIMVNPFVDIQYRSRKAEVDFDNLVA